MDLDGRMRRHVFFPIYISVILISLGLKMIDDTSSSLITLLIILLLLYIVKSISVILRLHDAGYSGLWWVYLSLIPEVLFIAILFFCYIFNVDVAGGLLIVLSLLLIVPPIFLLVLLVKPSERKDNKWGKY
ncbi:DUF805 domain-containing protein [Ornithobacterium rhinotracheale]|uniref:DUF805 domain-containing protein n=1 Tax=Ornithobacterium rhinotracheale (strain ATCC 51463 / DSM 15997 / CCUG 23171 / CIP 104009 / LMG 9086) TaxID=867902 RepID=I3ZYV5_ORNRL|nr:DUF805 domain-containing protein [Ornithobacterium rhinotracheale]AFL96889.1 Protein of unknown function (DUF805) [Ornithobacterium rhinotracheale DSM 15997]AIQ00394.1 hypothetical protein Q785_03980 [Ornithobacterium rhinotracheale ORT-UMN 88]KGB67301.1 hypothetical protein Q787_03855 [Ornithobacterium rhinotracheale H06-030791]MCK0194582.1 DUF805 domain-containing protein [Ornithobacterium rhinotracheale]MCK0200292.1 DUF805 domain-containing protein [Ornithobacterium rhinotracheale]